MIGWLQGIILEKKVSDILLNVGGVGYEIQVPMTTMFALPESGEATLHTHLVVREDAQLLYGFATKDERRLFRGLIKVNGVGPKLAIAILSSIEASQFVACVQNDDIQALVKIPGIGKKTAERLLIDMRDRLKDWFADSDDAPAVNEAVKSRATAHSNRHLEAESALISLGYKSQDAKRMIALAAKDRDISSAEELIRMALRQMAK